MNKNIYIKNGFLLKEIDYEKRFYVVTIYQLFKIKGINCKN